MEEGITTLYKRKAVRRGNTSIIARRMESLAFTTHIAPRTLNPAALDSLLNKRITTQLYHEMKRKRPKPIRYLFKDPPKLLH